MADELTEALRRTPEMQQSPGLAMTAYQSPDPVGTAQTLAHVGNSRNTDQAMDTVAQHHGGRSLLGSALHDLGAVTGIVTHPVMAAVGQGLHLAGVPLREVQHQYRYLHDVAARHGAFTALMEGAGILGAGAVGFVAGGFNPMTGVLAGEAAGSFLARTTFTDSFDRTKDGEAYLDPSTHGKVSIGRDLGHLFGLKEGSKPFTFFTGAADGIADLGLDPLAKVGKLAAEAKTAQGLRVFSDAEIAGSNVEKADLIARKLGTAGITPEEPTGVAGALGRRWGGLGFAREGDVDRAYQQYGSFRRAVQDIASKDTGQITTDYPKLQGLWSELGQAKTTPEVMAVFKDQIAMKELLTDTLPTRGPLSAPMSIAKEKILNWGGVGSKTRDITTFATDEAGNLARDAEGDLVPQIENVPTLGRGAGIVKKLTSIAHPQWYDKNFIDPETGALSPKLRTDGFPLGNDAALKSVYDSLRMGGMARRASQGVVTEMAEAGPAQRAIIFRQAMLKSLLQLGLPESSDAVTTARSALVDSTGGSGAGITDILGYKPGGENITPLIGSNGETVAAGLGINEIPVHAFPDWRVVMQETRNMHTWSRYMGKADEWAYNNYTTRIFKRAALLSGGFALRVATGEVLPRVLHDGFREFVRDGILANKSGIGREIEQEAEPHIVSAVLKAVGGTGKDGIAKVAQLSPEEIKFATMHVQNLNGEVVSPGLSAGHYTSGQINDNVSTTLDLYKGIQEAPRFKQGRLRAFFAEENDQPEAWRAWMKKQAGDPLHQKVAEGYGEGLQNGPGASLGTHGRGMFSGFEPPASGTVAAAQRKAAVDWGIRGTPEYVEKSNRWREAVERTTESLPRGAEEGRYRYTNFGGTKESAFADEGFQKFVEGAQASPEYRQEVQRALTEADLPDQFVVFRGGGRSGHEFTNVTLDPHTAESFAPKGELGQAYVVKRSDVVALGTPEERELIVPESKLKLKAMKGRADTSVAGRMKAAEEAGIKAGKDYLDSLPEDVLRDHPRHSLASVPGADPHQDWARTVMENLKGSTHMDPTAKFPGGVHGPHTMDFMDSIAAGVTPPLADFHDVPVESRPVKVVGHELQPMWGNDNNMMMRAADKLHSKFLTPIVNKLSREPLFLGETRRQWEGLAAWREAGMTDQEAIDIAQQRAGFKMQKYIHNLDERSQFAESWRNFMPFFFAQQQAWARAGRLLAEDPGAFRQYQLISSSLSNIGHVEKDADGVSHVVYPGSGFLGAAVPKIFNTFGIPMSGSVPVSFTGDIRSLGSALPLSETQPALGPLASIPMNIAKSVFPELQPGVDKVLGEEGQGNLLQSLVFPNATVRRLWQSQMGEHDSAFINSQVQTIQYLSFKQQEAMRKWTDAGHLATDEGAPRLVPPGDATPVEKQQFLDKVRSQTRVNFFVKAIIGAVSPLSPQMQIGDMKLNDNLSLSIKKDGFTQGLQNFLDKNPDATPYEVFGSETTTNTPLSASSAAGQFMESNMDLLKKYNYAAWLIPQSHDDFSQGVYREQLAQGLRKKRAPEDVMNEIYIAQGNHQYFDVDKKAHDAKVAALQGDRAGIKAENANWSHYVQNVLGPQNPVWFHDFMNGDREVQRKNAVEQLTEIFNKGLAPDTDQSRSVKELLDDYRIHDSKMPHGTGSGPRQKAEEANWQAYLAKVEQEKPEMKAIIQKVFRSI